MNPPTPSVEKCPTCGSRDPDITFGKPIACPDPWHDGSPSEVDHAEIVREALEREAAYFSPDLTAERILPALASLAALLKERDSLKAEIMKWEKVLPIATSNGGMRTTADSTLAWLNDHFVEDVQTEADNDRLREALERIARSDEPIHRCGFWRSSVDIARTALAPPTPRTPEKP